MMINIPANPHVYAVDTNAVAASTSRQSLHTIKHTIGHEAPPAAINNGILHSPISTHYAHYPHYPQHNDSAGSTANAGTAWNVTSLGQIPSYVPYHPGYHGTHPCAVQQTNASWMPQHELAAAFYMDQNARFQVGGSFR